MLLIYFYDEKDATAGVSAAAASCRQRLMSPRSLSMKENNLSNI